MSSFAEERGAISGAPVSGSGVTYTLGPSQRVRLEAITFLLTTDATAVSRNPQVVLATQDGKTVATVPDWNDLPASSSCTYTFAIGLAAFCGTATAGGFIQNDLPDTVLEPGATVSLESRNASTGVVVSGDSFTSVVLYGVAVAGGAPQDIIPLLTPIALADQAAA